MAEVKSEDRSTLYSTSYTTYAMALLVLVYIFNFIDRQILAILIQPIKEDLQVSDTALGFLTGTAFALFYVTMGLPIARLADRMSRRTIISVAVGLWSLMTALCGLAGNFAHLALARIGVAIGEAGCSPPIHSLLSDYFKPSKRATALSIYSLGIPLGGMLGLALGGWISEAYSWRTAFFVVGLPGLLVAVLVRLTLREPPRGHFDAKPESGVQSEDLPSLRTVLAVLWQQRSFWHLSLGAAMHAFVGYGVTAFTAAYIERTWEVSRTEIGIVYGLTIGVSGALGYFFGGWITDRLAHLDRRWYMWLPAMAMFVSFPFYVLAYLSGHHLTLLAFAVIPSIMGGIYAGPSFAMAQTLVPPKMRALTAAILLFIINLIGLGGGPQVVGLLSDLFLRVAESDAQSLQWALIAVAAVKFWSAGHFYLASRTLRQDIDRTAELGQETRLQPARG